MRPCCLAILILLFSCGAVAQSTPKVALIDFAGDSEGKLRTAVLSGAAGFDQVSQGMSAAAARGTGYIGSLNLRRDEARDLGASLGSDFYFLGKTWNFRRLGASSEAYFEASAAVFLIESRTGRLLLFDLATFKSAKETEALAGLLNVLKERSFGYAMAMKASLEKRVQEIERPIISSMDDIEVLDGEVTSGKTVAPVFFQRLKPEYTNEAALADVAATVELKAVFGTDGKVIEVEVERWAGFGLDESAVATVRALRFKPASREGRAIAVRAMVRYNFVKPPSAAEREAEAERLRRRLRQIGKP